MREERVQEGGAHVLVGWIIPSRPNRQIRAMVTGVRTIACDCPSHMYSIFFSLSHTHTHTRTHTRSAANGVVGWGVDNATLLQNDSGVNEISDSGPNKINNNKITSEIQR